MDFVSESALISTGYGSMRLLGTVARSEVVDLNIPGANTAYSLIFAGMLKMFVGGRRANLVALGMVANGVGQAWSDLVR